MSIRVRFSLSLLVPIVSGGFGVGCSSAGGVPPITYPPCQSTDAAECLDTLSVTADRVVHYYRNLSLDVPQADVRAAMIVVEGVDRDAGTIFHTVETASLQAGQTGEVLVISPAFRCTDDHPPDGEAYWSCTGWAHGLEDVSGGAAPISSFAVIDQLIELLADKTRFPALARIVVTGLSAGGQFTQRYAAFNSIDGTIGFPLEYDVVSPSSYVYLDASRLAAGASCEEANSCSGSFVVPSAASCSDYDEYPYGLEDRSGYVGQLDDSTVKERYLGRHVSYFVGSEDTVANAAGTDLDVSCEANLQGVDRVARALEFSSDLHLTANVLPAAHVLAIVPGCRHSDQCMYYSPQLRELLFPDSQG